MRLYDDINPQKEFLNYVMLTVPGSYIWLSLYYFVYEMQSIYIVLSENDP